MANLSDKTRKEQVLAYLTERIGEWIDGPEISNEVIGGSEGLKRFRELRQEGYMVQARPHPDKRRDIFQYRLVGQGRLYDEPTSHVEPEHLDPRENIQPGQSPAARMFREPQPIHPKERGEKWEDWKLTNPVTGERRCTFWVHKQRIIGIVAADYGALRWYWAVVIPAYKPRRAPGLPKPEKRFRGTVQVDTPEAGFLAASREVEAMISKFRTEGVP